MHDPQKDQENPPEEEGTAGEASSSPDRRRRTQAPSQTSVRVSVPLTEGVANPATPSYHNLPSMEGTRQGLPREEIAGPSGRAWGQGMNPINTSSRDDHFLRIQSLMEFSQQMMAETNAMIQQSMLNTTRFQEEMRGMYIKQNADVLSVQDERRTELGTLSENISHLLSLAVSTVINQATERQTQMLSDLLLNRSRVQAEAAHEPRTSSTTPSEGLAETEGLRRAPLDKGKARQIIFSSPLPSTATSLMELPMISDTPLGATTFQDQGTNDPGPSKVENSPRSPPEPVLTPHETPLRSLLRPHGNGGGGGGGGRGPGGPPEPPDPPDPPNGDGPEEDDEANNEWNEEPEIPGNATTGTARPRRAGECGVPPT